MYVKVNDVQRLIDQLMQGSITKSGLRSKFSVVQKYTASEIIRAQWHDAKKDPPKESGTYIIAIYWKEWHKWYYSDVMYSAKYSRWNCTDDCNPLVQNEYVVDYWMEFPMSPMK